MALYGAPSISPMFSPAFLQRSWSPSSVLPPLQARLPRMLLWWYSPSAPSTGGTLHTGAPSQRSRPVSRPVVLHVPALLLVLLIGPVISLLSGRRSWGSRRWVTSTYRLASLGCCSGGALLALLWLVVPYTLALSIALLAIGVSGSGTLQQRASWPTGCPVRSSR